MNTKKAKMIYWGIVFIALGIFIVLKCCGVELGFLGMIPTVDLLIGVIVLSIAVVSCAKLHFPVLPFELAVLFMIFEDEIAQAAGRTDTNLISNWIVILCALFLCVGIALIQGTSDHSKFQKVHPSHNFSSSDEANVKRVKMSSETNYINCGSFEQYWFSVKMGDGDLYFENTDLYTGGGVLNLECKMGDMTIHIPRSWHIVNNLQCSIGDVDCAGEGTVGGPEITLNGSCNMGNIDIVYC